MVRSSGAVYTPLATRTAASTYECGFLPPTVGKNIIQVGIMGSLIPLELSATIALITTHNTHLLISCVWVVIMITT
jgi:hypothetical protein